MADLVLKKEQEYSWIRYVHQRIEQNKNFMCFISGPTGSGKSYASLKIAELLDPDFNEERIVFSGLELMKLINNGNLKKGSVIVFEESGVGLSNKNWQSVTNKMLNFLVQTFRHKNYIIIFNSPYMDFVDSSTRRLFHAEIRTISIDFKHNLVKLCPQLIQYNSRLQKFYFKYLRVITKRGVVPVSSWRLSKPSKDLLKLYEFKKNEFTSELNAKIMMELEGVEQGDKPKRLTDKQQEVVNCFKDGLNINKTAEMIGCHPSVISKQKVLIEKKGYEFNPVKDGAKVLYFDIISPI